MKLEINSFLSILLTIFYYLNLDSSREEAKRDRTGGGGTERKTNVEPSLVLSVSLSPPPLSLFPLSRSFFDFKKETTKENSKTEGKTKTEERSKSVGDRSSFLLRLSRARGDPPLFLFFLFFLF